MPRVEAVISHCNLQQTTRLRNAVGALIIANRTGAAVADQDPWGCCGADVACPGVGVGVGVGVAGTHFGLA